jgi:hypothetical protein
MNMIFDVFHLFVDPMRLKPMCVKLIHVNLMYANSMLEYSLNLMPVRIVIEAENVTKTPDLLETLDQISPMIAPSS